MREHAQKSEVEGWCGKSEIKKIVESFETKLCRESYCAETAAAATAAATTVRTTAAPLDR